MSRCALLGATLAAALAVPAVVQAQVQRGFPQNALRGELTITQPPEAQLNGQAARLAPGSRIRGLDNMLVMSASIIGTKFIVNYTTDDLGLVKDVWILRKEEIAKTWPEYAERVTWLGELAGGGEDIDDPFLQDAETYRRSAAFMRGLLDAAWPAILRRLGLGPAA